MNRKTKRQIKRPWVKFSFVLTPDLAAFVSDQIVKLEKTTGQPVSLSWYVRELILRDRQESTQTKAA